MPHPSSPEIPYHQIDALFLDAGNTLVLWDHGFVAEEARSLGFSLAPARLARAEAAARPLVDRMLSRGASTETPDTLLAYLESMLAAGLGDELAPPERRRLVQGLASALRRPGASDRLWSRVPAALPAALSALRDDGISLTVVSNSDGSIEHKLRLAGIRDLFDHVIDSGVVGVEKPDPEIFRRALERSGHPPERTLHVGDLHAIDVVGAHRAGLHALLLDPHDDWPDMGCPRLPDAVSVARALLAARRSARGPAAGGARLR